MNTIERQKELQRLRAWQSAFKPDCANGDVGVTMRDYFAAAALQGTLANPNYMHPRTVGEIQAIAELSFVAADAMLQEKYK